MQWQFSRAASALALAFLASTAFAPGVSPSFAQQPLSPVGTSAARRTVLDDTSPLAEATELAAVTKADEPPLPNLDVHTVAATEDVAASGEEHIEAGAGIAAAVATRPQPQAAGEAQLAAVVDREAALEFLAQLDPAEINEPAPSATPPEQLEPVWEDQYLFADGELPPLDPAAAQSAQPFGVDRLAVDLTSYTSDDDFFGEDTERGARVFWSRETENWGTFDLDVQVANVDSTFFGRETAGSETVATLRQTLMPVSATAMLNTTAGHQRTATSSLLHGGYRYRIPSSIILGFDGELTGVDSRARVTVGDIGAYRGIRMPRFDDTGGRMTSFAYERTVNDRLELGAQLANISGDDNIRDHTSALVAGRYRLPDDSQQHAFRVLADDDSQFGFWADSRLELARLPLLRFGVSYLEPDLVWADWPIPNDQLSTYVRADKGNSRYDVALGYDYLETGLRSDALASMQTHSAFFSGQLRLRRALSLGGTVSLASRRVVAEVDEDQDIQRFNIYASLRGPIGTTRFELFSQTLDSQIATNRRERQGVAASLSWRMPERVRLTTELRTERTEGQRGNIDRTELSALFRYDLLDNFSLGLTSGIYSASGDQYAEDDGLTVSADARWTINRNWQASLSVNRNRADYDVSTIDLLGTAPNSGTTSVWLTVSYQRSKGQPYPVFGRTQDGMSGSGSIRGQLYFDENRDSIRQPSERAAAGVVVVLDGQYETRTDGQGRYSFSPVPTGAHEVLIVTEDLPLPWGLDNEAPRRVIVRFREEAPVDFPLIAMD